MGVLDMESPILGNFAPPEAQNPTNRRPFWKYVLVKKGTVSKGRVSGHPGHPLDPPMNNVEVTFDFVEATFDFVAKNGNNVELVYRKTASLWNKLNMFN